ncbi:uncharacterized protein LOC134208839 [Armigeres subalbatus]|uniref:uncharacterized protein LOC134208839 n=1 Tax=Armigeres subalbatus TaxID=124917 RepID=UPI002ED28544
MQHADALSRSNINLLVEDECTSNIFEESLCVAQHQDPDVKKIKEAVECQQMKDYEVRNAVVYKVIGSKSLVYVPERMVQSVINKFHNQMGHFGVDKVCELIKRAYWFPRMRERVQEHAKSCVTCIAYNPRNKKYDGNLYEVDKPRIPFEVVHVDHLGPLERTKDHGIKHVKVATACPKSNGQVERYNNTLVPLLGKMVEESGKSWDTVLTDVEFLLNNTVNRSTGKTASTLLFGVNQRRRIDCDLTQYLQDQNDNYDRDLGSLREAASESMRKQQQYNKHMYDSHCKKNINYQTGDLVMLRRTNVVGERSKLKPKFRGPYIIKKVLDNNRYVVADLDNYQVSNNRFEGIFDPLNMRLYQKAEKQPDVDSDSEIEYEDIEYLEDEED